MWERESLFSVMGKNQKVFFVPVDKNKKWKKYQQSFFDYVWLVKLNYYEVFVNRKRKSEEKGENFFLFANALGQQQIYCEYALLPKSVCMRFLLLFLVFA